MSAKSRYFLDTNVLVYTFNTNTRGDIASIANIAKRSKNATDVDDAADLDKQRIATGFVERALDQGGGVISTQVLQEFLNLVTRRHIVMKELDRLRYLDNVLEPL